jgi:16S rRNA (guanine1207-N2)-methyltransferase
MRSTLKADRSQAAAGVLLGCVNIDEGRVMVIDDRLGQIQTTLSERGCTVISWQRMASTLCPGTPWPDCASVDAVTLRLSKDKTAFDLALHAAASRLRPEGKLWVYGANDEGIKSAPKRISAVFGTTTTLISRNHCRVLEASRPQHIPGLKPSLSEWLQHTPLDFSDGTIDQASYPGVFAKGRLDGGTRLLLETVPPPKAGTRVLDYAAGSGVIALGLSRRSEALSITLVDADAISIEAARINLPEATTHIASRLDELPDIPPFDLIVTNPPYHDGKPRSSDVIRKLIADAPARMTDHAAFWIVVQKQVDVSRWLGEVMNTPECMAMDGRFRVWRTTRKPSS